MAVNKILIVDDQQIFRIMLRGIISDVPDMQLVGEASSGQEAIELAEVLIPDVVVMDIELNGRLNGIQAGKEIKKRSPTTGIVLFSTHISSEFIVRSPGWSYLLKSNVGNVETLLHAINGAAWGLQMIDPEVLDAIENVGSGLKGDIDDAMTAINRTAERLGIQPRAETNPRLAENEPSDNIREKDVYHLSYSNPLEQMTPEQKSKIVQFTLEGYTDDYIASDLRVQVTQIQDWRSLISDDLGIEQIPGLDPRTRFIEGYMRKSINEGLPISRAKSDSESNRILDLKRAPDEAMEVLRLVAQGLDNSTIAASLRVSESLVREYLTIIYSILQIGSDSKIDPRSVATRVYVEHTAERGPD